MLVGPECPVAAVSEAVLSCRRPSFAISAVGSRYTSGSRMNSPLGRKGFEPSVPPRVWRRIETTDHRFEAGGGGRCRRRNEVESAALALKTKRGRFAVRAMHPFPAMRFSRPSGLSHSASVPSIPCPAKLSGHQAVKEIIVDNSNPRASALKALAEHVKEKAASGVSIVVAGPRRLTPTEERDRQRSVECLAAELDNLAETINQNTLTFG